MISLRPLWKKGLGDEGQYFVSQSNAVQFFRYPYFRITIEKRGK